MGKTLWSALKGDNSSKTFNFRFKVGMCKWFIQMMYC